MPVDVRAGMPATLRVRTPLRVSFFGGGTDYPEYLGRARGAVVGMAIDRYVHVSLAPLPDLDGADRNRADLEGADREGAHHRVRDARIDAIAAPDARAHPLVRAVLRHYAVAPAVEIGIEADLPARSGLGGSSSAAVGLLHLIFTLQGRSVGKPELAQAAVFVERELLGETVGLQDQYHAAYGGLNRFDFPGGGAGGWAGAGPARVTPVPITGACEAALTSSLFLLATGVTRAASDTLAEQVRRTESGLADRDLSHLLALTDQAMAVLQGDDPDRMLADLGAMLDDGWQTKKRLSSRVSAPGIDRLYEAARTAGALGGKLCGAGGGGFLLVLVPPARRAGFFDRLRGCPILPIGLDRAGSTLLPR